MAFLAGMDGEFRSVQWPLESGENLVGRRDAKIVLNDASISGRHGTVTVTPEGAWLEDLGSTNGTTLNGERVLGRLQLKEGDVISFGTVRLAFKDSPMDVHVTAAPAPPVPAVKPVETPAPAPVPPAAVPKGAKPKAGVAKAPAREVAPLPILADEDLAAIRDLTAAYTRMKEQVGRVIVGQTGVVEDVLIAIFCRAHALLVGVPGLAKTLLISTLSRALSLDYKRIQFTPDLMPSDITGTDVLEEDRTTGKRVFRFVHGPIFTNMMLADEINRTPPKTQAALLEAMQEHHVTVGERSYKLNEPFFVLATQNPIEQEGTYPLPEAQLDRFMFNIQVGYPTADEESEIIRRVTAGAAADVDVVLHAEDILRLQKVVRRVPVADHVIHYARDLARATRPKQPDAPDFVKELVGWGAGPRAGINLIMAAKARAILYGRFHATTEDVSSVAHAVLRHRVITTFNAEAAGVTSDEIITRLIKRLQPKETLDL